MSLIVDIRKKLDSFSMDVSFEADREVMALLGASGSGKSMTLKCIAGIETPDEGRIILNGRTLFDSEKKINLAPRKRRVGYLFQQYALFPNMTVRQNIMSGARGRPDAAAAVEEKICAFRLEGLENKRPSQLSGGQQQRVALARILVNQPEVLLLDEPFSALDSYLRWELEMELADTLREFDRTAVFVSHNRKEVYRLCDKVCVLSNGVSERKRGVRELFEWPDTLASCRMSGCKNFSAVEILGPRRLRACQWGAELETDRDIDVDTACVGVHSMHIRPAGPDDRTNVFPCTVARLVEDEDRCVAIMNTDSRSGGDTRLRMETEKSAVAGIKAGSRVNICIEPKVIMLLKK